MKRILVVQTEDGVLHKDEVAALRHADKRYGDVLTSLAHRAVRIEKYTQMIEFIKQNLDEFVRLKQLADDMKMEEDLP